MIALGGVVVDDVENHLEPGGMQPLDHLLEFLDLLPALSRRRIFVVRREEADGVVAPIVAQSPLYQMRVMHELVNRHQLDGGDAERHQVVDDGRIRQRGVGAAQFRRNIRMQRRQPFDVRLEDHAAVRGSLGRAIICPVEIRIGDDRARHVRRAVAVVFRVVGLGEVIREHRFVPLHLPLDRFRVGIEQQLCRVAAVTVFRFPRPMHSEAVALAGLNSGNIAVPAPRRHFRKIESRFLTVLLEQTEFDPFRDAREDGKIDADPIVGGAERIGSPRPDCFVCLPSLCLHADSKLP